MKIYVGCALKNASQTFRDEITALKKVLEEKEHHIIHFRGDQAKDPHDVYRWDIKECVANCDMMLAICDLPSLGVGYEMATAIEVRGIPVLAVAHEDADVSWLIQGIDHPLFTFVRYNDRREIPGILAQKLSKL